MVSQFDCPVWPTHRTSQPVRCIAGCDNWTIKFDRFSSPLSNSLRPIRAVGEYQMRKSREYGGRKHERIDFRRPAFVVLQPGGPWLECMLLDISEGGARLEVGTLPVSKIFILSLTPNGEVRRTCMTTWRRGPLLGARFVGLKEIRRGFKPQEYVDPRLKKIPVSDISR